LSALKGEGRDPRFPVRTGSKNFKMRRGWEKQKSKIKMGGKKGQTAKAGSGSFPYLKRETKDKREPEKKRPTPPTAAEKKSRK